MFEIRLLVPTCVPVLTLTATATKATQGKLIKILKMKDCVQISQCRDRPSITYIVERTSRDIEKVFCWLVDELHSNRVLTTKVLVVCRSVATCTSLYVMLLSNLQENSYEQHTLS